MRELTLREVDTVSGGAPSVNVNCFGPEYVERARRRAHADGMLFGSIVAALAGIIGYGSSKTVKEGLMYGSGSAIVVAPYFYIIGSYCSSAWNIYIR